MKNSSKNLRALEALTVPEELMEVNMIGTKPLDLANMKKGERVTLSNGVTLERSFDQKNYNQDLICTGVIRFVRIVGPAGHKSLNSDLSMDGLKEWGII